MMNWTVHLNYRDGRSAYYRLDEKRPPGMLEGLERITASPDDERFPVVSIDIPEGETAVIKTRVLAAVGQSWRLRFYAFGFDSHLKWVLPDGKVTEADPSTFRFTIRND